MPEIPLPLLLLRGEPIRTLAQEDGHIAQIHAEALGQPLALAPSSSLAVEPGASGPAEAAFAVPFPCQAAGVAVAEVAGVAAHGARALGLGLLLLWVEVVVLWVGEAVALVRVFGFGADGAAAGGDGEGVGEDGGKAVGAAGGTESVGDFSLAFGRWVEFAQTARAGSLGLRGVVGGIVGVEVA